jgi:hypothetical protein
MRFPLPPPENPEENDWTETCDRLHKGFTQAIHDVYADPNSETALIEILNMTAFYMSEILEQFQPQLRREWIEDYCHELHPLYHFPHELPNEPLDIEAYKDKIVKLEADLTRRLIPPFMRASRTVLHGRNACAATRALLEVTGTIVLQTLDQIPATPRQDWIKRFRARLDTTLLSPHSMSIAQYLEGPFKGLD